MATKVSFMHDPDSTEFTRTLNRRIQAYFKDHGISRHANGAMLLKVLVALLWWAGSYTLILLNCWSNLELIALYLLHGFGQLFMAFNLAHDANHSALSSRRWVNQLFSLSFDVVGVNSYMWRLMHNDSHHFHVNIQDTDVSIRTNGFFRFSPGDPWRPHHRYQHIYAPWFYCLATLEWVFLKDFNWFLFKHQIGNAIAVRHPLVQWIKLFLFKGFYFGYVLALPMLLLDNPAWVPLLGFVLYHFGIGFAIALIFQTTHVIEGTTYPKADEHGRIPNNYISHLVQTTADYAWRNPVANWFYGCLNVHTVHHIYPQICHVHYPRLTPILIATAQEYGFAYREHRTVWQAFRAHLRMLKALGQPDYNADTEARSALPPQAAAS